MRAQASSSVTNLSFATACFVIGCAAAEGGDTLTGDDDPGTSGTSGMAGDTANGGTTSGSGGATSGSGGQGGSGNATSGGTSSGGTSSGGTSSGGTSSGTGGTTPTGGTGGTSMPPGRATIPLPYTDDFETSEAADWRFTSVPWTVIDDGGNKVLRLSGSNSSSELTWAVGGDRNWTDVRVEMRVKFVSGEGMILLSPKWKDLDGYAFVEYEAEDKPKLRRRLAGSTVDLVTAAETMTFALGQWHTVAVTLQGNSMTLEFDGVPLGTATDSTPVPNGGIGIAVENGIVAIDDVTVTVP